MTQKRQLPQSMEAEQALLSSMMVYPQAVNTVIELGLHPDDFYAEAHKRLFKVMLSMYEDGKPIDAVSVTDRCNDLKILQAVGGVNLIMELADASVSGANTRYYIELIQNKAYLRNLILTSQQITEDGFKSEEDIVGEFQKIGFAHISSKLLKCEPELKARLGQDFELFRVGDLWLDAAPKGISKLTGIQQVMALHQLDPHEVMTVGDSHNDYTMIHAFPLGIAMGNADPEIKEIAAEVTLSNVQHGVAAIIRKHILT